MRTHSPSFPSIKLEHPLFLIESPQGYVALAGEAIVTTPEIGDAWTFRNESVALDRASKIAEFLPGPLVVLDAPGWALRAGAAG